MRLTRPPCLMAVRLQYTTLKRWADYLGNNSAQPGNQYVGGSMMGGRGFVFTNALGLPRTRRRVPT